MSQHEKLLQKARNNPGSLNIQEFKTLMSRCGWVLDHQRGSHQIWYSKKGYRIPVQSASGRAKSYQVKQFLQRYEEEENDE